MIKNQIKTAGSALITALLITAIVAVIATLLALQESSLIKQTQLIFNRDHAQLYFHGVQGWAEELLMQELSSPVAFPQTMPATTFQNVTLSGTLTDQMGLFNLNSLVNVYNQKQFIRLLKATVPDMNDKTASYIAQAITDWIMPSNADEYYLRQDPPYRASHQLIVNMTELRLIAGITPNIYKRLADYVTALPITQTKININSASWPILMSLADNLTAADAQQMVACRQQKGLFSDANDFLARCSPRPNINWDPGIPLFTSSNYFMLNSRAITSEQQFNLQALLERDYERIGKANRIVVKTLWQSYE